MSDTNKHLSEQSLTEEETSFIEKLKQHYPEEIRNATADEQAQWLMEHVRSRREHKEQEALFDAYLKVVQENYAPLHPHLHNLESWAFEDSFLQLLKMEPGDNNIENHVKTMIKKLGKGLYTFPMLKLATCNQILEEVEHFEKWCLRRGLTVHRPNSMNNYGAILDHFGFSSVLTTLTTHIGKFAQVLYPHIGNSLDGHHGFIVEYAMNKDRKLDFHVDDSEVTLNLCLGKEFTGGSLYFGGIRCHLHQQTQPYQDENLLVDHNPGVGLLHVGKHRHAATALKSGHRLNLILWCKSQTYRHNYQHNLRSSVCPQWCDAGSDASSEEEDEVHHHHNHTHNHNHDHDHKQGHNDHHN